MEQPDGFILEEDRYRILVDAITDYAIYMLDPTGRVVSWNAGAERFKGYTAPEIIGEHFSRFYTPEDREAGTPERALRTATEAGRFENEGWRLRKDGTRFWAHVIIDPIRAPSGTLLGFAKITRDLTERKAAAEALRRSEEQFKLLVQGVTDYAIYLIDPTGKVSSWNAGAERIKGYRPDEIIGEHFSRFYTEADRAAGLPDQALDVVTREGRFEKEGWRVRKDGSRFWAHVVIDAIRDDGGAVIGFAKITRDITERKAAAEALDAAREALLQAQKLEAIGQLTGGVAHDFNNLLMVILGSLELAQKRVKADPRTEALIKNALQGAQRGAALTQRMLAFARKQELKSEVVDLPVLIEGMTELMQRAIGPAIQIETRFAAELPLLRTDANQLESLLLNLAVNARDAMPAGGVIVIEASAQSVGPGSPDGLPEGDYVRLSVTDTGHGMDVETLARATEPFFTTKGVGKGTGLGLSMALGIAQQSGGQLKLHSQPGAGTTVELFLPRAGVGEVAPVAVAPPAAMERASASLSVLAVDDDPLVLMNTTAMLEDLGHRVVAAASASEALIALQHRGIDLVITDYAMPESTGVQLADAIHAECSDLPVILATGYAELPPGAVSELPRLSKPFSQGELAAAIRRVTEDGVVLPNRPADSKA